MQLDGQTALITGASRGIGRAIAVALGSRGAFVIGTATAQTGAQAITETFAAHDCGGCSRVLDVSDAASVAAFEEKLQADGRAPAILVNNAGVTRDNLLMRMREDEWQAVIDTNLTAIYRLTRLCLRNMVKARYGRIINISSVVGLTGNPGQSNYAASKAGMIGFTRALAREVGARGVTVNVIAPGFIETDMTAQLPEQQRQRLQQQIALGRLGSPEEIAEVAAFLASPAAAYITGETINVNGGMHMG